MDRDKRRSRDAAARGTGGSSGASKRSAAQLGYTEDRFVRRLVPRAGRRAPAIHRGYYIRARAVGHCAAAFLRKAPGGSQRRQVLSLGAGLDSLYFCLKDQGLLEKAIFLEVDFPDVAAHKAALIASQEELAAMVGHRTREQESGVVHFAAEDYRLLGVDLAELPKLEEALCCAGLNPQVPTLLLAEVVLTYMEVERSDALIHWASRHFSQAWFVLYEQIHPDDPFGQVMQNHFRRCHVQLCSLTQYPDLRAQQMRFVQKGWAECHAIDMKEFYDHFVSRAEQRRIQALEPFDEFEVIQDFPDAAEVGLQGRCRFQGRRDHTCVTTGAVVVNAASASGGRSSEAVAGQLVLACLPFLWLPSVLAARWLQNSEDVLAVKLGRQGASWIT